VSWLRWLTRFGQRTVPRLMLRCNAVSKHSTIGGVGMDCRRRLATSRHVSWRQLHHRHFNLRLLPLRLMMHSLRGGS